jgi:hypothetical protein
MTLPAKLAFRDGEVRRKAGQYRLTASEVLNIAMRPTYVEFDSVLFALKHQSQIKSISAFHKWLDSPQSDTCVQVRVPN